MSHRPSFVEVLRSKFVKVGSLGLICQTLRDVSGETGGHRHHLFGEDEYGWMAAYTS